MDPGHWSFSQLLDTVEVALNLYSSHDLATSNINYTNLGALEFGSWLS